MEVGTRKNHHWDYMGKLNTLKHLIMGVSEDSCETVSRHTMIALRCWPFILGMLIVLGINKVEHWFFPVIEDFHISKVERQGDYLIMSGFMRKVRDCQFSGVSASITQARITREVPITYLNTAYPHTATHAVGNIGWGPWQLAIPKTSGNIEITASHLCHSWWTSQTQLAKIPANFF